MNREVFINTLTEILTDTPDDNRRDRILEATDEYVNNVKQAIVKKFNAICEGCTIADCRDCRMTLYDIDVEDICECENLSVTPLEQKNDWLYDYLVMHLGKEIVDNKEEFHKWFERMVWHVKRCDELSAELRNRSKEPGTNDGDTISRRAAGNDMDSDAINRQRTTIPSNPQAEDSMDAVIALITTALKKQVPMAHELRTVEVDKDGNALHDRFCPSCGHRVREENYCSHCGQALEWG